MRVPHFSPTTPMTDEQRLILRATAGNLRDHTIIRLALDNRKAQSPLTPSGRLTRSRGRRNYGLGGAAVEGASTACRRRFV